MKRLKKKKKREGGGGVGVLSVRVNKILAWGKFSLILVFIFRVFFIFSFTHIKRLGGNIFDSLGQKCNL